MSRRCTRARLRPTRSRVLALFSVGALAWLTSAGCQSSDPRQYQDDPRASWDPRDHSAYNRIDWDQREWDGVDWGRSRISGH